MKPNPPPQLPASIDAERTIIGACLLDPRAIGDATDELKGITAEDFYLDSHRRIFLAMQSLYVEGNAVDLITVSEELDRKKELQAVGGPAYLSSLTEGLPRRLSIMDYMQIVAGKSLLRQIVAVCSDAVSRATDQTDDPTVILRETEGQLIEAAVASRLTFKRARERKLFVDAAEFIKGETLQTEWLVNGVIQLGGNGIFAGDPKSSKSMLAFHLAIHLAAGKEWFGHDIPRPVKVGIISREDYPGLSKKRFMKLIKGIDGLNPSMLNSVYFNTRSQSATLSLQNEQDVLEIIDSVKERKIEFLIFDVFRRLWDGDENDNQEVAKVLAAITRIQTEAGCACCLVHHVNKSEGTNIFKKLRGASAIHGWHEWALGVSIDNPDSDPQDSLRKIVFETKADEAAAPLYYEIKGSGDTIKLVRTSAAPPKKSKAKTKQSEQIPF